MTHETHAMRYKKNRVDRQTYQNAILYVRAHCLLSLVCFYETFITIFIVFIVLSPSTYRDRSHTASTIELSSVYIWSPCFLTLKFVESIDSCAEISQINRVCPSSISARRSRALLKSNFAQSRVVSWVEAARASSTRWSARVALRQPRDLVNRIPWNERHKEERERWAEEKNDTIVDILLELLIFYRLFSRSRPFYIRCFAVPFE